MSVDSRPNFRDITPSRPITGRRIHYRISDKQSLQHLSRIEDIRVFLTAKSLRRARLGLKARRSAERGRGFNDRAPIMHLEMPLLPAFCVDTIPRTVIL